MTWLQAIVAVAVALLSGLGGSYFSYRQFILKRKDEKEEKNIQKMIDDSIAKVKEDLENEIKQSVAKSIADCGEIGDKAIADVAETVRREFQEGLKMRGEEGRKRFETNSEQIGENTRMIKEILNIQKEQSAKLGQMVEAVGNLAQVSTACAESQRTSNYDRLLIVTSQILKSGEMTITDKTNLKQLYESWKKLQGKDPKIDILFEECMEIKPSLDKED